MKKHIIKHVKSQQFAINGLITAFKTELNFRIEIVITLILMLIAILLKFDEFEWFLMLHAISTVIIAELLNTGLEYLANGFTKKFNPHIKNAKDITAGAVLVAAIYALFLALLIMVHYISR